MSAETRSWSERLTSTSASDQASALQEMAEQTELRGYTAAVVRLAGCRDDEVRRWAAELLEVAIAPVASDVEELADLLAGGEEGEVCYWAATMLGRLGPDVAPKTRVAVDALEICLGDSLYLPARERAAWALSQIGPSAASAAITLRRTAEDAPPRLQRLVAEALEMIGEAA
ncbi:hypothetical protein Poly51_45050 [Rubripirellula tenax]|uniref:HEAT repeat protein n=1 Tax=Rubripirellula tenax TaxID=2528015 RepID=A0A5C6EJC7_9BACT|nr:hypothetical protein [Rubripirellula tenax]TWU48604.1 hypothetical protein Poly51_45050 [Rubripirellula tenax]